MNPDPHPDAGADREDEPAAAVFDLDGTLTDTRHRNHWIEGKPRQWEQFFAAAGLDEAHPEGLAALRTAHEAGLAIVYLSGRPERTRDATEAWLRRHDCPAGPVLLRSDRDRSPAAEIKLRALRRLAQQQRLALLVDDDPAVVDAIRRHPELVEQVLLADWQPRQASTPFEADAPQ